MRRISFVPPRPGWEASNEALGLAYNRTELPDGSSKSYWKETACYDFTLREIETIEEAVQAIARMRVAAGDHIVGQCPRRHRDVRASAKGFFSQVCTPRTCLMARLGIPEWTHEQIIRTWEDDSADTWTHDDKDVDGRYPQVQTPDFSPSIYGRLDLWYAGEGTTPKLLEYNAQTPTALLESGVIQWQWLEQNGATRHPEWQFNSIHDRLVGWEPDPGTGDPGDEGAWRRNIAKLRQARPWLPEKPKVFFAYETSETSGEDRMNTAYLQETCAQAGFPTELIAMSQIGRDPVDGRMVFRRHPDDPTFPGEPIDIIFALYPWEWMWREEGSKAVFLDMARVDKQGTVWIEPPYTAALWGNKGFLAVMWELFGDKPEGKYLLPTYLEQDRPEEMISYARKPVWGREGDSVTLVRNGVTIAGRDGQYGAEGYVCQELCPLPAFPSEEGDRHPVIGAWLIDGQPAGIGIREGGPITDNFASFVPHTIESHL